MPNATSPLIEQRVLGFALAHPTVWGGFKISPNRFHKVLRRHGLNTKAKRLGLVAGYTAPSKPIEKEHPGERQL